MPISAGPGSVIVSVPCALKVCGERALTRGRDKKVSSVLEVERLKIGAARAVLVIVKKLVCGESEIRLVEVEVESHSAEELLIILEVSCLKSLVACVKGLACEHGINRAHIALNLSGSLGKAGREGRLISTARRELLGYELVVRTHSDNDVSGGCARNGDSTVGIAVLVNAGGSSNGTAARIYLVKTHKVDIEVLELTAEGNVSYSVRYGRGDRTRLAASVTRSVHILLLVGHGRTENEAESAGSGCVELNNHSVIGI